MICLDKMIEKPLVTIAGRKILFKSNLHQRLIQDLPQESVEWRRRLDSNSKSVYIDVDFVDFDIDNVESACIRESRSALHNHSETNSEPATDQFDSSTCSGDHIEKDSIGTASDTVQVNIEEEPKVVIPDCSDDDDDDDDNLQSNDNNDEHNKSSLKLATTTSTQDDVNQQNEISQAFFNRKLLGRPILHTYWADKTDFDGDNQKSQFDVWIGQVQASTCTEWAIIIIEDGDFKAQLGTALFKSKLQSTTNQANASSSSISSMSQTSSTTSFLDRMKKGLSTMFQNDSNSDRWLTLVNQERSSSENKAQESYTNFIKKLRNIIMASFSKQIELFEEQLRVQREMRTEKSWDFFSFFSMQEELAFAFEFLTLFDEALVQYDLLDALYTEYISSSSFNSNDEPLYKNWTNFESWQGLCLDMSSTHSLELRRRIVEKEASLLDLRNYLFAMRSHYLLMQNQPWRVAASTSLFLHNCIHEHEFLKISIVPGALSCWSFVSALEVLQKCECYSCTSTMENYSLHTVDIWDCARRKLLELGQLSHQMPGMTFTNENAKHTSDLLRGLGPDPHKGVSYQNNEISPQARLRDALAGKEQFSKHFIEISELTLGTYKHIGRKRHALLVGKELATFYMAQSNFTRALPFLIEMERVLKAEKWDILLEDIKQSILTCEDALKKTNQDSSIGESK